MESAAKVRLEPLAVFGQGELLLGPGGARRLGSKRVLTVALRASSGRMVSTLVPPVSVSRESDPVRWVTQLRDSGPHTAVAARS